MNNINDIKLMILNSLDKIGIFISEDELVEDIALSEYITDSIQFISFIIEIENDLGFELPDEFFLQEVLSSLNGFAEALLNLVEKKDLDNDLFS